MSAHQDALSLQGLGRFDARDPGPEGLQVEAAALAGFNALLAEVCETPRPLEAAQLRGAAQAVLGAPSDVPCPFVTRRMAEASLLRQMHDDRDWPLAGPLRQRIEAVLAYVDRAEDLIPDEVPRIGLLDDAILVELFLRRAGGELGDYEDYCGYRHEVAVRLQQREAVLHVPIDEWLAVRRQALAEDRGRRRAGFAPASGFSPFRIR